MKCPKCKRDIKDSSKFCGYCGNKFKTTANQAAPTPAPSVQPVQPLESNVAKCPKCGSTSLQARKKALVWENLLQVRCLLVLWDWQLEESE